MWGGEHNRTLYICYDLVKEFKMFLIITSTSVYGHIRSVGLMSEHLTPEEKEHSVLLGVDLPFHGKVRAIVGKAFDTLGIDVFVDGDKKIVYLRLLPALFEPRHVIKLLDRVRHIMEDVGKTFWNKYRSDPELEKPHAPPTREHHPLPAPPTPPPAELPRPPRTPLILTQRPMAWFKLGFTQNHWEHVLLNSEHSIDLGRRIQDPLAPEFLFFWTLAGKDRLLFHYRGFATPVEATETHLKQVGEMQGVTGTSKRNFEEEFGRKVANWKKIREVLWE
jgi:hypothetical protein